MTSISELSLDGLLNARRDFARAENRLPTVLVMHPVDKNKFIDLMHKAFNHHCDMEFEGMEVIRSFDVEVGKWRLY